MILGEMYAHHTYSWISRINLLTINRLTNAAVDGIHADGVLGGLPMPRNQAGKSQPLNREP
jgi:hypothetical protein